MKNKLQTLLIASIILVANSVFSKSTTWNGSAWSNSAPSGSADIVTITGNYTLSSSITYGSLTISNSATMTMGASLTVSGNLTLAGGTLYSNGNTLILSGNITVTGNSTLRGNSLARVDINGNLLTINGGSLTLNNFELVIDDLTFSSNHYINSSNGGFLSFDNSSQHSINGSSGASPGFATNNAHVNAKVRLYTANGNSNTFYFPIGDGTVYSPFIFDPTNVPNSGTSYTHYIEAIYTGAKSTNTTLDLTTLNSASGYEYWTVATSSSSIQGQISLRYDNNAGKTGKTVVNSVSNINSDLIIANYISGKWSGISSSRATASSITVVSSTSTSISPNTFYTLASNNSRTSFLVPLPVSLINFSAIVNKEVKSVELNWATASEENNQYFEVMKTTDFVNWTAIGRVYSKGSGNDMKVYNFVDAQPSNTNHYKLKVVSNNGEFSFSDIKVARLNETLNTTVIVYPNPANASVNLKLENMDMSNPVSIQLVNPMGQIVFNQIITENFSNMVNTAIQTSEFAAGIYQVNISGSYGTITQKLIITH